MNRISTKKVEESSPYHPEQQPKITSIKILLKKNMLIY
jgi:hypothetical protein